MDNVFLKILLPLSPNEADRNKKGDEATVWNRSRAITEQRIRLIVFAHARLQIEKPRPCPL